MAGVRFALILACLVVAGSAAARAEVVGVQIDRHEPFAGGRSFGAAGPYELLVGHVFFAVDPQSAANANVADIAFAPRDAAGRVRFSSDFVIVRPVDARAARPAALLEVLNRGHAQSRNFFFTTTNAGGFLLPELKDQSIDDPFAFEQGFTLAYLGWETDPANGTMHLDAPLVRVTGPVRGSMFTSADDVKASTLSFSTPNGSCPTDASQPGRRLVAKDAFDDPGATVAPAIWHFTSETDATTGKTSCEIALERIVAERLYEVTYRGGTTAVAGLGDAALRDFASYLKTADAASPLGRAPVTHVLGFGYSQSARYLREFLRDGFNADERGRIAFDGMMISSAGAGVGSFDQRYATTGEAGTSVLSDLRPVDVFPFTDGEEVDPLTGDRGGLLDRAHAAGVVPKIVTTFGSSDYWNRFATLTYTTVDARTEVPIDANARLYFIAGAPHAGAPFPPKKTYGSTSYAYDRNFGSPAPAFRALLMDLDAWVARGTPPPPSVYPHLADGLVSADALAFPAIPNVPRPAYAPKTWRMDFGPRFASQHVIDNEPPKLGAPYVTLVPKVDADGNDEGGIALPFLAVPLGTFTGWNVELPAKPSFDYLSGLTGAFVPFALTADERKRSGDARPSLAERYASRDAYIAAVRAASRDLVERRFMLDRDVDRQLRAAGKLWDYFHIPG